MKEQLLEDTTIYAERQDTWWHGEDVVSARLVPFWLWHGTMENHLDPDGTMENHLDPDGTMENHMDPDGTMENHMEHDGTIWNMMEPCVP